MSKVIKTAIAAAVALMAFGTAAGTAAERNDPRVSSRGLSSTTATAPQRSMSVSSPQAVAANAANARVALVWDFELGIVRSKNVVRVRNPSAGMYCIQVASGVTTAVRRLVPQVTPDFSGSSGQVLLAYYREIGGNCLSNEIGVLTKRLSSGSFVNSDNVGFSMIAP